jgi:hypothetical protein
MKVRNIKKMVYLLRVSTVCDRLVVIVFQNDVTKLGIGNIFNDVIFYWEETIPLVLLPKIHARVKIHRANHLCHFTELTTHIDLHSNLQILAFILDNSQRNGILNTDHGIV